MFFTRRCLLSSTRSENRREGSVKGGARLATVFSPVISERNGRSASLRGRTWPVSRDGGYFTAPLAFFFFAPFLSSFSRDSPSSLRSTRVSLRFFPPRGGSNVLLFLITKKKNNGDVPNLCTKHYFKTLRHLRYRWWYVGCFFFFFLALSMRFGTRPTVPQSLKRTFSCITVLLLEKGWFFIYLYFLRRGCWGSRDSAYLHVPVNALAQKSA